MGKKRIDSTAAAIEVFVKANKPIAAPKNIRMDKDDLTFFNSVIAEFARSEWSAHQLELAALLARAMVDMEREQFKLREDGSVLYSEKGTPVVNPRKTVVQMTAGTILSMRRSLSLHARAQAGENRDIGKRRHKTKEIEAGALDDDLISRPN